MNSKRPVNLDLSTIKLPLSALTSITHRITGVIMFVGLIFMFWAFQVSLSSPQGFETVKTLLQENFLAKFVLWGLLSALAYHCVAGIKHLIMDLDIGVTLEGGHKMAQAVVVISAILILLAGIWVW
ncbi:succinate dehydrogenase subunit C [Marinospirillum celere]|uniref:Succinate dehydrogenase cytochrome b556 subunit n=1 Tax=Marinospirillum celere TaxID=1122252 RepID=A0A1I1E4B8_9GAMM|nr:succinate dehydrogenase, cytochrome b556 subunit [Marinospirillum celere]SFB82065.1 succinate dehydrogenase subunit C [Marinospirillum celere]